MSSATSELLPDPATPVTHVSTLRRYPDGDVAQVVGAGFRDVERVAESPAAPSRPTRLAPQGARRRAARALQAGQAPREDHLAAAVAGAGADVDDPVGRADDRGVVLDHEHRVALVAQPVEHGDEVVDVPRMEPDGGLVEDVDEVDEVAVELAGGSSLA